MTTQEWHEADQDDADRCRSWPAQDAQEPVPNVRTVTTANSTYEINEADRMIRRLHGANDPTERQGKDGAWQEYRRIEPLQDGLLIVWDVSTGKCTWTSKVVGDTRG